MLNKDTNLYELVKKRIFSNINSERLTFKLHYLLLLYY